MRDPFNNMYDSFQLFGKSGHPDTIQLSAGVNWTESSPAIIDLLKTELDFALTYRNYGRSSGAKILTDIVSYVERKLADGRDRIATLFTNGTCDSAHIVASILQKEGRIRTGECCLAVGHCFPYYYALLSDSGLRYEECIDERNLTPSADDVLEAISATAPSVIILMLPHNPAGRLMAPDEYTKIVEAAAEIEAVVFLDRVCMMMWDYRPELMKAFYDGIVAGHVFVFDSLSKSDSLAGLRAGYLQCAVEYQDRIEKEIRYRTLNPIVFSTPAIAFGRMATLSYMLGPRWAQFFRRLLRRYGARLFPEYPSSFGIPINALDIEEEIRGYVSEQELVRSRIRENFEFAKRTFEAQAVKPLVLDGGFNLLLELDSMKAECEESDQSRLCNDYGVAILTERCFRGSYSEKETYCARLGLSLPPDEFQRGIQRLCDYYSVVSRVNRCVHA